jgi:ComF family protein
MFKKDKLLNLLFPIECLGCGREDEWLCCDCRRRLQTSPSQSCIFCGNTNIDGHTCRRCAQHSLDGVFSAGFYEQRELKNLIGHLKYSLVTDLSSIIAEFIARSLDDWKKDNGRSLFPRNSLFIPLPISKRREKWRGFNQSAAIASLLAKNYGWEKLDGLLRIKNSKPQARLTESRRQRNVADAFRFVGKAPITGPVILIDDVATTGATLEEAAKELKKAGVKSVWGLTAARG